MRGSPLLRTLCVLIALVATGLGLHSVARDPARPPGPPVAAAIAGPSETTDTPFFLTFSSRPAEVILEAGNETVTLRPDGTTAVGSLPLPGDHPTVFLRVRWGAGEPTAPRFAKLTLEPSGQPTQTRIFDGFGEIDDVWELHLHP